MLVVAAHIAAFFIIDPFGAAPHPSDADLIAQFRRERAIFERIVEMTRADPGLRRLDFNFTRPDDPSAIGIPPDRIALYRRLCKEAGVTHGFNSHGGAVFFIVHTRAMHSGKGILYDTDPGPDAMIVEGNIDNAWIKLEVRKDVRLVRRIDGPWWVHLDIR